MAISVNERLCEQCSSSHPGIFLDAGICEEHLVEALALYDKEFCRPKNEIWIVNSIFNWAIFLIFFWFYVNRVSWGICCFSSCPPSFGL